jgi:hypothetical protein
LITSGGVVAAADVALDGGVGAGITTAATEAAGAVGIVADGALGDAGLVTAMDAVVEGSGLSESLASVGESVADAVAGIGDAMLDGAVGLATDVAVDTASGLATFALLRTILPDWLFQGGMIAVLGELAFAAFVLYTGAKAVGPKDEKEDVVEASGVQQLLAFIRQKGAVEVPELSDTTIESVAPEKQITSNSTASTSATGSDFD